MAMLARRARLVGVVIALLFAVPATAGADRIAALTHTIRTSPHHKARIAAAVSLGRVKDRRALRPLVLALRDRNRTVRVIAATALGHLGEPAALAALRRASSDDDSLVRKRAMEAIAKIRNRRALRDGGYLRKEARRNLDARPELFVVLKSTHDESGGRLSKRVRAHRAQKMRSLMLRQLRRTPEITLNEQQARRYGISPHAIDVSITRFTRNQRGALIEVECQLRIAVSNKRGKMTSVLSGGAKVQVPVRSFKSSYLPQLRLEALENAVKGVHQDLLRHLRRNP